MTIRVVILSLFLLAAHPVWALNARLATAEDVALLKQDLLSGKVQVGKTRLKQIRTVYGDPDNITDSETKLTYDYGDLRIEFDKTQYFRKWEYDSSRKFAAKDEIDDLRFDLEDQQLIGEFVSYDDFVKDYDSPTEAFPSKDDGDWSTYYWGEIKVVFENYTVVKSWRGKNLVAEKQETPAATK